MLERTAAKMSHASAEKSDLCISIGKVENNAQVTTADTGWSEEEKERMKAYGYDGLDMVRAWYS